MIRALNVAFIVITGFVCLGLYRIAEEARIASADLKATHVAIARENEALTVLGAEWARLTQPARIQALAERHLDLTDQAQVELSALTQLPSKNAPLGGDTAVLRDAKAVVPMPEQSSIQPSMPVAVSSRPAESADAPAMTESARSAAGQTFASIHAGT